MQPIFYLSPNLPWNLFIWWHNFSNIFSRLWKNVIRNNSEIFRYSAYDWVFLLYVFFFVNWLVISPSKIMIFLIAVKRPEISCQRLIVYTTISNHFGWKFPVAYFPFVFCNYCFFNQVTGLHSWQGKIMWQRKLAYIPMLVENVQKNQCNFSVEYTDRNFVDNFLQVVIYLALVANI